MAKHVVVYSTPTCPYCNRAKQFLKENNIGFEDIDVTQDHTQAEIMIEKSGQPNDRQSPSPQTGADDRS